MANIYPPILTSQASSIPSIGYPIDSTTGVTGAVFEIDFTMPSSTEVEEIGHVQVLIQRQSNLDHWSSRRGSAYVPEKTTIYLPVDIQIATSDVTNLSYYYDAEGSLSYAGSWKVLVPYDYIRGIESTGTNEDAGSPGFPAGVDSEGETFTVQLRFGTEPLDFITDTSVSFANWNSACVTNRNYGEWSNTQKVFVYALKDGDTSIADRFEITIDEYNPVFGFSWSYTPVSEDSLILATLSYDWTLPGETDEAWNNYSKTKSLTINGTTGTSAGSSGDVDLSVLRVVGINFSISFTTINNTSYTYEGKAEIFSFSNNIDTDAKGVISQFPIVGEEMEDGVIAMSIGWDWHPTDGPISYNLYRMEVETLELLLLKTVDYDSEKAIIGEDGKTIYPTEAVLLRDYAVEMGTEYIYFPVGYTSEGKAKVLIWDNCLNPDQTTWSPSSFEGYSRNLNFQGNSFLTSEMQQLRLQGNVTVSSFKRNTSDKFTTTIGGEYPFYSRASAMNYRTFTLNALVGLDFDTTNTFLAFETTASNEDLEDKVKAVIAEYNSGEITLSEYISMISLIYAGIDPWTGACYAATEDLPWSAGQLYYRDGSVLNELMIKNSDWFSKESFTKNITRRIDSRTGRSFFASTDENGFSSQELRGPTTIYGQNKKSDTADLRQRDETSLRIYAERKFRDKVMRWLSDGKPKLFRSETEGNMIVMVTGASFSPFMTSRQNYSFSATITEIAEFNLENTVKYGLVPTSFSSFYLPNYSTAYPEAEEDESIESGYIDTAEGYAFGYLSNTEEG